MRLKKIHILIFFAITVIQTMSCKQKNKEPKLFEILESNKTGLNFTNKLTAKPDFNMFKYMYFYNGAGVATGDFNNDGLIDIFFTSNQGNNKIYLNKSNLKFEDVSIAAKIPKDSAWSTGASVIDINNDGLLDIYVSRVGNFGSLQSKNQFLICKGINKSNIPYYEDEAEKMQLDFSAFGTQAAFLDYDADGDLDMYMMNHSLRYTGTFNERKVFDNTRDSLAADFLFKNDNGKFVDVSKQTGILGTVIGYGLGLCVADINMDGWPDIYVANDFHENDYIYINQKNGSFKDEQPERTMHTSQFSMGVDIADINNDAAPDIITMDMLPYDPKILKHSLEEDDYNLFYSKIKLGYQPQFSRNALQLNRNNKVFSEVGMYAGVSATDWSWAALWLDFDNNGWKDLFISNGIPKRLNDMDYVNYVGNEEIQEKIRTNKIDEKEMAIIEKFPVIKIPNQFFLNKQDAKFTNIEDNIANNKNTFSNGAAYADFDNDGDIDVVVNNIDDPALLYENKSTQNNTNNKWLQLKLEGASQNINALGTKVIVYTKDSFKTFEKYPVRGFQSSMETPIYLGLGATSPDSIILVWPDNTYEKINYKLDTILSIKQKQGLPIFNYTSLQKTNPTNTVKDITAETGINFTHEENPFNEFDREQLMPKMISREGPALAVADINGDNLDDIFIGSAKFKKSVLYIQLPSGKFILRKQTILENDSTYEDVDANFEDLNNDGFKDLMVASGGNEYYGNSEFLLPRVYLNDGKGNFTKGLNTFGTEILLTASCIKPYDFNKDGFVDLFIGGRAVPWEYGVIPKSYLLQNNGKGIFKDVTNEYHKELSQISFVTNAAWADMDKDGNKDLVVSTEWGGIIAFKNNVKTFDKKIICEKNGWWNFILPIDINADGNTDLVAGNCGENNRFQINDAHPLTMFYNDFDDNEKKEQFLTYDLGGKNIPFADKDELTKQTPILKKRFLYAMDLATSTSENIYGKEKIQTATKFTANYFSNALITNNGNWNFNTTALPWQAQLSTYTDAVIVNANNDNKPDVLLAGNFYPSNLRIGKYDADYGTLLVNNGKGNFTTETLNNLLIKGEARRIRPITINQKQAYIIVRNNDSAVIIQFEDITQINM
jgi:enediyne biosynthesis protein E4